MSQSALAKEMRRLAKPYLSMMAAADAVEQIGNLDKHVSELVAQRDDLLKSNSESMDVLDGVKKDCAKQVADTLKAVNDAEKKGELILAEAAKQSKEMLAAAVQAARDAKYELTKKEQAELEAIQKSLATSRASLKRVTADLAARTKAVEEKQAEFEFIQGKIEELKSKFGF